MCLQRNVDLTLIPNLDVLIRSQRNITKVYKDQRSFVIGPHGNDIGKAILDVTIMFNESELTSKDVSNNSDISKKEFADLLKGVKKELEGTRPELCICRFWAQKTTQ